MFITYFEKNRPDQSNLTEIFYELLDNPNIDITEYKPIENNWLKVTRNIKDKYAFSFYEKHPIYLGRTLLLPPFDISEIPKHYHSFKIPKKTNPNKLREIDAPDILLKQYQTSIKSTLEDNYHIQVHNAAHAYVRNRSTITAIQKHQENKSKWFLKLDLKDFFPSHNKEYIMQMLKEVYPFGVIIEKDKPQIEKYVDYALLEDKLPQGTPLSPLLTNICMVPIDFMITKNLQNFHRKHFIYTRYADDLLISCRYKFNPGPVITAINKIFKHYNTPFRINKEKTRFGSSSGRNWNLGIMLNKDNKITIGHRKNQKFRAMLYDFICNKETWTSDRAQEELGNIAYYKAIEPDYINYTIRKYNQKYNIDILKEMKKLIAN